MKINSLQIKNFKSIVDVTIKEPNPFSVFIGPNASGKSNVFEAIEFFVAFQHIGSGAIRVLGGREQVLHFNYPNDFPYIFFKTDDNYGPRIRFLTFPSNEGYEFKEKFFISKNLLGGNEPYHDSEAFKLILESSSRIFVNNNKGEKIPYNDDSKLSTSCSNLEKVLRRILLNDKTKEEIIEWLQLLVPGFENIEVAKSTLSDNVDIAIYEKGTKKPFGKNLISDGTYNILCLLTALYQSDKPQFLCIEEPENGLNPKVIKELVTLFRQKCVEGNFIWLNTHSQTLVSQLTEKEIIVVDKIDGETQIKQFPDGYAMGLPLDEAWFSNVLGGGNPW